MSRKKRHTVREQIPDPVYGNARIAKFINKVMYDGKKTIAQRIVYSALESLSQQVNEPAVAAFEKVLKNAAPLMEVKSRRVGGSTYQVPIEVKADRGFALAVRWIINNSRARSGKSYSVRLAEELLDTYNKVGSTIKKREETHKMAESNKAFSHFRW
ncbi:30S ribosomal protein S7 [bacterium]|nr:30S ribosomal protein S7 [bacterium]